MTELDQGPVHTDKHFHSRLRRRLEQRGITKDEGRKTVQQGWKSRDAKTDTHGRTLVFTALSRA
jgi:hypothetical protein